jgi:hypothetical protein
MINEEKLMLTLTIYMPRVFFQHSLAVGEGQQRLVSELFVLS